MLSRVANCIYWLNRYVERAENYARFMDVNFNLTLELPSYVPAQWLPLITTTGDHELFNMSYDNASKDNVIRFLTFDESNPSSIYNCLRNARENARTVRPEITKETWEQLNHMYMFVKAASDPKKLKKIDLREFFNEIKKGCHLFYGITDATISRTDGWHFGNIGRMVERADKTSRILDVKYHIILPQNEKVGSTIDIIQWAALLKSVSAYDMYRKKNGKLSTISIVDFLILDPLFPRSINHCTYEIEQSLKMISITHQTNPLVEKAQKKVENICNKLVCSTANSIVSSGLHEYIDDFQVQMNELSNKVFDMFYSTDEVS